MFFSINISYSSHNNWKNISKTWYIKNIIFLLDLVINNDYFFGNDYFIFVKDLDNNCRNGLRKCLTYRSKIFSLRKNISKVPVYIISVYSYIASNELKEECWIYIYHIAIKERFIIILVVNFTSKFIFHIMRLKYCNIIFW